MLDKTEAAGADMTDAGTATAIVCIMLPVLNSTIASAVAPGLMQMAHALGGKADGTQLAQVVLTLPSLMVVVGAAVCGVLYEGVSRRTAAMVTAVLYALFGAYGLIAGDVWSLAASRLALGFTGGSLLVLGYATLSEYYPGHARERMIGFASAASSFSAVAVLVGGGWVVDHFGWRAPFAFYLVALALLPFIARGLRPGPRPAKQAAGSAGGNGWGPILTHWPFLALLTAYTVGMFLPIIQMPVLAEAKGIASATLAGTLISVSSLAAALLCLGFGRMSAAWGFRGVYVFISLVMGAGGIIAGLMPGVLGLGLGAVVFGSGIGLIEPAVLAAMMARTPDRLHERVVGATFVALYAGQLLNPWVVAPLRTHFGIEAAFAMLGLAYVAGGLGFLLLGRNRSREARLTRPKFTRP